MRCPGPALWASGTRPSGFPPFPGCVAKSLPLTFFLSHSGDGGEDAGFPSRPGRNLWEKVHLARTYHADKEEAESLQQDSKDKVLRMRTVSQMGVMRAVEPPDLGLFQIA